MAAILKLLQTVDPLTRQYIRYYKISEIYESLLSGASIVRPDECIPWLIEKLELLHSQGVKDLKWDMFIPEEMRPKQKPVDETTLSYIFNILDQMLEPTQEMIEKAYNHYNKNLNKKIFISLRKYYIMKLLKRKRAENNMKIAIAYHTRKTTNKLIKTWLEWLRYRKDRQAIAYSKISRILTICHSRLIIQQWNLASKEARQTREYFENLDIDSAEYKEAKRKLKRHKLERGEALDNDAKYNNGEARDDISMLPRSAAIKIFSYLSIVDLYRSAQVCRSWKMITNSNVLWSKLDLYPVRDKLNDKLLSNMIHKSRPYLIHLNVRGAYRLKLASFIQISGCRNIQDLNLTDCRNLTDDLVNIITSGCVVLLYLNLSFNPYLTDYTIRYVSKNCTHLQYLSIAFTQKITDRAFAYIASGPGLKNLLYIDLSGCVNISPLGCHYLSQYCSRINTIKFNSFESLTDNHLKCCLALSQLTEVAIMNSPALTDTAFKFMSAAKHLQKVKIASNKNLTDTSIKLLTKTCAELKYVAITDCEKISDMSLKCLSGCKNLSVLNLADCVRISDVGVKHLSDGNCVGKLRELNLTNCLRIGTQSISALSRKCKTLEYLTLCYCEQIEEEGIDLIGTFERLVSIDLSGCRCSDNSLKGIANKNLRHASFAGCGEITDLGLQKFCAQCPNMETLDLSNCLLLTDNSLKSLAFCCKFMMNLNLSGCTMLTDMSIQYLSGVCIYLQILDLSNLHLITDKSLKYLSKGCKHLKKLKIVSCINISREAIDKTKYKINNIDHIANPGNDISIH